MKYLLWLLCTKPVWAWHILWYSYPNNPVNRSNRHIGRVREYNQLAFPLAEAISKSSFDERVRENIVKSVRNGFIYFTLALAFLKLPFSTILISEPVTVHVLAARVSR